MRNDYELQACDMGKLLEKNLCKNIFRLPNSKVLLRFIPRIFYHLTIYVACCDHHFISREVDFHFNLLIDHFIRKFYVAPLSTCYILSTCTILYSLSNLDIGSYIAFSSKRLN